MDEGNKEIFQKQEIQSSYKIGLPKDFTDRMEQFLGIEYDSFLKSYQEKPTRGLRVNLLKGTKEQFLKNSPFFLTPVLWEPNGFYFSEEEHPGKHPYHEAGVYYIQEPSAMAVAALTAAKPGEKVLDLCAAPGGKTTHLASQMQGQGLLIANEMHPARAKILSQNVERMGIKNTVVTNETPASLKEHFSEFFDRIVVDAPCSGEGMFRKDEMTRQEWSLQNVVLCAKRQKEILDQAANMLKPGGRMVYSTCTFAPEENEKNVIPFLETHPEFEFDPKIDYKSYTQMGFTPWHPEQVGAFRLFPHKIKGEGHFIAIFRKKEGELIKKANKILGLKEKALPADWEAFQKELFPNGFRLEQNSVYQLFGNELYLVPKDMTELKGLKILRPGLHLGSLKKKRFQPSHSLALALSFSDTPNVISFDKESKEIFAYLKGETLPLSRQERKGWTLVCVNGYSIGWGKISQDKIKNHYPKGLRWV